VLQRGNDLFRRSTYIQPALTVAAAKTMVPDPNFNAKFNGGMPTSVLFLENGPAAAGCPAAAKGCMATTRPAGGGLFFAATGGNDVYALDETTGAIVWHTNILPTGSRDGVRGTPIVDTVSRSIVIATGANGHHEVHSLSVDDGSERTGWPVTLSPTTLKSGATAFQSGAQNQHGALLALNGIVYVPFGGEYGDGGNYNGWVVAIEIANPSNVSGWATLGGQEGIWGHGGLASDGTSVFAVTGNGHQGAHAASDAEEVVRITGMAQVTRSGPNVYYPSIWQSGMDSSDKDFGASTPAYTPLPMGSNPPALLVAPAKPGHVYFLNASNLSQGNYPNPGGELADLVVASTSAESVYTSPTIYTSASGLHAAIDVSVGPVCPAGSPTGTQKMILSMLIQPGQTPLAKTVWCAAVGSGGGNQYNEPPISTTTDGTNNALVWFMNGAVLTAVDGDTGAVVFSAPGSPCNGIEKMSWPIVVKGRIIQGADGQLCAWKPPGI
jgi:outer membrane protein assembly factor BamB